ncbi:hypothetical protein [Zymomonas mobilis]|uniref:hypothetical protein n=1 Tax=Zymomonas mobilis TaxID=542 RepID=UPI0039EB69F3
MRQDEMKQGGYDSEEFERSIRTLSRFNQRLSSSGEFISILTLTHIVFAFVPALFIITKRLPRFIFFSDTNISMIYLLFDFFILIYSAMLLIIFEKTLKLGEIYFSEIANEHNWSGPDKDRLRLDYRIALREFSSASTLPLAGNRLGLLTYVLINAIASMGSWMSVIVFLRTS